MKLEIESVVIGSDFQPKIIAEIGINHGGSLEIAKTMAVSAISHGAHIIKHQTHIPLKEMSLEAELTVPGNSEKSIFQIMEDCALQEDEEFELARFIREQGGGFP